MKKSNGGEKKMPAAQGSNDSNLWGAIAYFAGLLTGVIAYLAKPEDKYVKHHAVQSILLSIAYVVVAVVLGILTAVLGVAIPLVGAIIGVGLYGLYYLAVLALWLWCMWKAYKGEKFTLPVIGNLAQQYAK